MTIENNPTLPPLAEEEDHVYGKSLELLPPEITINILSRLPLTALMQFKATSHFGRDLVADPFVFHLNRTPSDTKPCLITVNQNKRYYSDYLFNNEEVYFVDTDSSSSHGYNEKIKKINPIEDRKNQEFSEDEEFEGFRLVGCCNGLLCIEDEDETLIISNPFFRDADPIKIPVLEELAERVFEFVYDPKSKSFKVIIVVEIDESSEVQILTVETKEWQRKGPWPDEYAKGGPCFPNPPGAVVEGSLHWMVNVGGIISLDLETEVFSHCIPLPVNSDDDPRYFCFYQLTELRGCLALTGFRFGDGGIIGLTSVFEVWVMCEYKVKDSWVKKFSIQLEYGCGKGYSSRCTKRFSNTTLLYELNNGEVLLEIHDRGLFCYDPKCNELKPLRLSRKLLQLETFVIWPTLYSANEVIGSTF